MTLDNSTMAVLIGGVTAVLVGMLTAIPPSIVAWANMRQQEKATSQAIVQRSALDTKIDALSGKADVIHNLTNGTNENLTRQLREAMDELRLSRARNEALNLIIDELRKVAYDRLVMDNEKLGQKS